MIVIGYVRVSTQEQAAGESPERQAAQIRDYCKAAGLGAPVMFVDNGVTGSRRDRPAWSKVEALCRAGAVHAVVAYDQSRLFRRVRYLYEFVEDVLQRQDIALHLVHGAVDVTTAAGKAQLGMRAVFDEDYRNQTSEKTKRALAHKRAHGEKCGGTTPYGYDAVRGELVPNADELAVVIKMTEWRSAGAGYRCIARRLQAEGVRTKSGRTWWQAKTVSKILSR